MQLRSNLCLSTTTFACAWCLLLTEHSMNVDKPRCMRTAARGPFSPLSVVSDTRSGSLGRSFQRCETMCARHCTSVAPRQDVLRVSCVLNPWCALVSRDLQCFGTHCSDARLRRTRTEDAIAMRAN